MKKIFFVSAAMLFLAVSCGSKPAIPDSASKVDSADEAADFIIKDSTNQQTMVTGSDDADLVNADSAELNSLTEVPNAQ